MKSFNMSNYDRCSGPVTTGYRVDGRPTVYHVIIV